MNYWHSLWRSPTGKFGFTGGRTFFKKSSKMARTSKTKAFRRTDISQVEEKLADLATEKQVVGTAVAEQSDAALFSIDKKGQDSLARTAKQLNPLKLDEIVRPKSKIDVPPQKKLAKVDKDLVKRKLSAVVKKASGAPHAKKQKAPIKDIWAEDIPMPSSVKRPAEPMVKSKGIKVPAPGASYNPDAQSHDTLIAEAAAQEVARLERIEKVKAEVNVPLAPKPDTINYDEETGMIYEDIFDSNVESEDEQADLSKDDENLSIALPEAKKRKTKTEKRKELELKAAEKQKKMVKLESQLDAQALHAKTLLKTIKEEKAKELATQRERAKARKLRNQKVLGKKLGPNRFVHAPLEVKLPEELTGSLRTLKPEGNLLEDRFKALQEQAKIEPRVRRALKKRKYELKEYEKHSFKNFI